MDYQSGSKQPHSKGSAVHCPACVSTRYGLPCCAYFSKTISLSAPNSRYGQTEAGPTAGCSDSRKRDVRREEVPRRSRVGAVNDVGRATDRVACDGDCDEEARAVVIQEIRPARIAETGPAVTVGRVL